MPRLRSLLPLLALAYLVALPSFAAHPSRSKLKPCKTPRNGGEAEALCADYQVWENRAAKSGRKITLKVLVLPALGPNPKPDPIIAFGGGPGQAATGVSEILGDEARQDRDLLFIDQRGTGGPDRLPCLLGKPGDLQSMLDQLFPLDAVRRCRDDLSKKYDLTLYSTAAGADDVDEVRAWLGYDKLNLAGYSYGTRMAQVYLKRHPKSVRTVTLWGSVPMDEALPISHSAAGQRSLDLLFELCEQEAACSAKFPVRKDFQAVMARLDQGPIEVEVPHPETQKPVKVQLPREVMVEAIRSILYDAQASAYLPLAFHEAAAGDWGRLSRMVVRRRYGTLLGLAHGLFFSVVCAEDMPFIPEDQIAPRTAGSFLGDARVRRQKEACALWPRAAVEPGHREVVRSDLPVLAISGRRDPVTPPDFGRRALAGFSNSLFLEIPYESHGISGDCPAQIAQAFLDRASLQGLDTSCVAAMKLTPFALEPPHPSRAKLDPCQVPGEGAASVDDVDEIRAWLGYEKVNVVGTSYGTRTAQTYLRRHSDSVRTVTLWGVVPMDEPISLSHAAGGQRALDLVLGWCEEDATCRARFPEVRKDFKTVMDRLSQGPIKVEIAHPETKQATRVQLSREVVADGIRVLLYSNKAAAALPLLLHQAAAGDWKPLGQAAVDAKRSLDNIIARGMFFSVTCSEDIPFINSAEIPARTAGSFLGDYRVRQQSAACALWPRATIDPAQREAVRSDLPVLLINGESDPVTPPEFGRRASRFLTQSLHLVEPYASHEESPPCVVEIADEFVRRGTTEGLDTSCVRQLKLEPFVLKVPEESRK